MSDNRCLMRLFDGYRTGLLNYGFFTAMSVLIFYVLYWLQQYEQRFPQHMLLPSLFVGVRGFLTRDLFDANNYIRRIFQMT